MKLMRPEWKSRLDHWIHTLKKEFYEPLAPIALEGFCTFEALSPEQAAAGDFAPMPVGTRWGEQWQYCWMRSRIVLPEAARGQWIVMSLDPGGESTLFVNGKAFGTRRAEWVTTPHHYIVDQTLTRAAEPGEAFDLLLEAYAGHFVPQSPLGGCSTGPVRPGDYEEPDPAAPRAVIGESTFGIWHEAAYQLWLDVEMLREIMDNGDPDSLRTEKIEEALCEFTLNVDFEQPRAARLADYVRAREALRPLMEAVNGSTAPEIYAIGNAHLDVAWLWPLAETERKTARTFAQQLRLMDEYPDYKFLQSMPQLYQMCKEKYPELYERIKQRVREGRWIADGAMWVEPDTNMAGGEALIRQLLYGKRFYQEEFGVDCRLLWLPDTFGYTGALPQILKGCGVDYLTTQKIFWTYNDSDRFPYHYFTWQGMDGSEIKSFLHMEYESRVNAATIMDKWKHRVQRKNLDAFLLPFGYGDGGGGPTRDDLEQIARERDIEGVPKLKYAHPVTFFEDMENKRLPENRYVGELYFQCHRGTYTTQAAVKRGNRKSELAMREMELWSAAAMLMAGAAYPAEAAERLWKGVLLNQFHDILPGSSIGRVYVEANRLYDEILAEAGERAEAARGALTDGGDGVTVFNSLSWDRDALIALPERFACGAADANGDPVPVQRTEGGLVARVRVPSCGWTTLKPARVDTKARGASACLTESGAVLENGLLRAVIGANGEILSLTDPRSGRSRIGGSANVFHMYKDVPRKFDAWDIDSMYDLSPVALDGAAKLSVCEASGLRASVRVEKRLHDSTLVQYIRLEADSARLDFDTEIEWRELHKLLKVSFPTGIRAENGLNEMQFGYVERPTHRSRPYDADRFEVCNHRYTALCDSNGGAAVLNESKYGVSMLGDEISLTLLRAAACPEMRSDNGTHRFTYSYYVWDGPFMESGVVREGWQLNQPAAVTEGCAGSASLLRVDAANVIVESVKAAEDGTGDVIVRLYECKRADTQTALRIGFAAAHAYECDMLENAKKELALIDGAVELSFHTFEIKTLRLCRKA